jgi:hypothetical protein
MPRGPLRYDGDTATLFLEGYGHLHTEGGGDFAAPFETVQDLRLAAVRNAMLSAVADQALDTASLRVSDEKPEHFGQDSLVRPDALELCDGELQVRVVAAFDYEPAGTGKLEAQLGPLLGRVRAQLTSLDVEETRGYWTITATIRWRRPGATVGEAFALGDQATVRLAAGAGGGLTRETAADLIRSGNADLLIGETESVWLEVKSHPYRLDQPTQEFELAKDVAAIANAGGGLLLLGAKTKRLAETEEIRAVNGCLLTHVSPRRYRRLVRRLVYPEVSDLAIELMPGPDAGQGVALIDIPPQDPGKQPFIVHGRHRRRRRTRRVRRHPAPPWRRDNLRGSRDASRQAPSRRARARCAAAGSRRRRTASADRTDAGRFGGRVVTLDHHRAP